MSTKQSNESEHTTSTKHNQHSTQPNSSQPKSTQIHSTKLNSIQLNPTELHLTQLNQTWLNPTEFNPTEPNLTQLNLTQLNRARPNSTHLNPMVVTNSTQISTITMYMGGIGYYVHGYWPQRPRQSQSVNQATHSPTFTLKVEVGRDSNPGPLLSWQVL